ncbi:hypothetical protein PG994_015367 [Apiospora phragmitis]|uniref:Uncharacterized protein n=1 Tax=Apiospora phragmitis TaxID=2905665 RepID=A0ABR1SRC0_9PEZI
MDERRGRPAIAFHINLKYDSQNPVPSTANAIGLEIMRIVETEDTWQTVHDFSCKDIRQQNPADTIEFFLSDLHEDLPREPIELRYGQIVQAVDEAIEYHLRRNKPETLQRFSKARLARSINETSRSTPGSDQSNDGDDKEDNREDDNKKEDPSYRGSVAQPTSSRRSSRL